MHPPPPAHPPTPSLTATASSLFPPSPPPPVQHSFPFRWPQCYPLKYQRIVPRRNDIKSILLIGSGPIVIGQGCEFDYSGTQAVRALKEEGFRVILVNSNPATIMTDPELADRTYIEPITPEWVERIIERERPDALLPTMAG